MFSSEAWLANPGANFYNGVATQSLRLNDNDSANVTRSPSSAGDRQTWVWSGWVKRANVNVQGVLFLAYNNANNNENYFRLTFTNDAELKVNQYDSNLRVTNKLFRDASAWYHIVCAVDTHQATANNRTLVYVNGEQITDFSATGNYAQDAITGVNHTGSHRVGGSAGEHFDGYMAEVNFIDGLSFFSDTSGTANTSFNIDSFGETKNGVWIAKKYTGSYGTNGFRLQFNQTGTGTASASTIGADTSGNTNHLTSSGIVASDCAMSDSPENGFANINPLIKSGNTYSEGNLKVTTTTSTPAKFVSTIGVTSGKWFMEFRHSGDSNYVFGITSDTQQRDFLGMSDSSTSFGIFGTSSNSNAFVNNSQVSWGGSGTTWSAGDIIGLALNADDSILEVYKNGSSIGSYDYSGLNWSEHFFAGGNYVAGTYSPNFGQDSTFQGAISAGGNADANGIGDFKYAVPSSYLALCTSNLPEPTISPNADTQADNYFNTVLYSGTTGSAQTFDVGFVSDFAWFKARNQSGYGHQLYDSSRGVHKFLQSNVAGTEQSNSQGVTSFNSSGNLAIGTYDFINEDGTTMVIWNWKANGGTTSSVDAGSGSNISNGTANHATVQANQDAGFSIVTTTLTVRSTAVATIPHGLGSTPHFIIAKQYDTANIWSIYHQDIPSNSLMLGGSYGDDPANSGSNFSSVGGTTFGHQTNSISNNANENHIFYCFKEIAGYSRFGSYVGNGSNDGTFVHLGFRPAFIMIKRTNSTGNWVIQDSVRQTFNPSDAWLRPNTSDAEGTTSPDLDLDFVSNGFKIRNNGTDNNISNSTYIYMAFAEAPFKYANAR